MLIRFDKWLPDNRPFCSVAVAENVFFSNGAYHSLQAPSPISDFSVTEEVRQAVTVRDNSGSTFVFIFSESDIYRFIPRSLSSVGRSGGYTVPPDYTWVATQYGDTLVAVNFINKPQMITPISNAPQFNDMTTCPWIPRTCAMYKDFLFVGHLKDDLSNVYPRRLARSALGDIESWDPDPDTGAGWIDIPEWGGRITGLVPLADSLMIYMDNSIWRADFVGPPVWFNYQQLASSVGAVAHHAIINVNDNVHYILTEKDVLEISPQNGIRSIADGVRQTLLQDVNFDKIYRISQLIDYANGILVWLVPTSELTMKLLIYNYNTGHWSVGYPDLQCVAMLVSSGITINNMDNFGVPIDQLPYFVCDSAYWSGGSPIVGGVDTNGYLCSFGGSPMTARIRTGAVLPAQNDNFPEATRVAMLRRVRPVINSKTSDTTCTVNVYHRESIISDNDKKVTLDASSGKADTRITDNVFEFEITTNGLHDGLIGIEADFELAGGRDIA